MIRFFTQHPTAANLLMLVFLALGLLNFQALEREPVPDFSPAEVQVRVTYPGATAEEVEETVLERIEDALAGLQNLGELRSEAQENLGIVTARMGEAGDIHVFRNDLEGRINAIDDFPENVRQPLVETLGQDEPVLSVLISGPEDPRSLRTYAETLRKKLLRLPEVKNVILLGFSDQQVQIRLSASALHRAGLSVQDVAQTIARQSLNMPAGSLLTQGHELLLRVEEEQKSPETLAQLSILSPASGSEIRLGELAELRYGFSRPEDKIELNGHRVAKLQIRKGRQDDSLRINDAVRQFISKEQKTLPPGMKLILTEDGSKGLLSQLKLVSSNGLQGMLLVFLTMWVFFSFGVSFWVVMSLPVSFLGAAYLMPLLNLSINTMTLIGLLLALGLLMDDGIVIAENISAHLQKGKTPLQAALDGVSEVSTGVFYSFLTTLGVLGPLAMIRGDIGKQLKVVPMILILVLAVSLIEAFLILPAHLGHWLKPHAQIKENAFRRAIRQGTEWVRIQWVGQLARLAVQYRYAFTGTVLSFLIVSVGLFVSGRLPFVALPPLEGDLLVARLRMPQGTSLTETEAAVQQILNGLEAMNKTFTPAQPGQQPLVQQAAVQFGFNPDTGERGSHVATLSVDLLTAEIRQGRLDNFIRVWSEKTGAIPGASSLTLTEPAYGSAGRAIHIRLSGLPPDVLQKSGQELKNWFSGFAGIKNLALDLYAGKQILQIRLKSGAPRFGLSTTELARQLNAAYLGLTAREFQYGTEAFEVDVALADFDQSSLKELENFLIRLPSGELTPLKTLATLTAEGGWSVIRRVDSRRTVTLYGDVDILVSNTDRLFKKLQSGFLKDLQSKYQGLEVQFEGEVKEAGRTRASMLGSLLLGLLGVYFLLSFQFRSYSEPLIVMMIIPLALIGVFGGHLLLRFPFSMPALLGTIALAGIVVNDSLLLVEFIKQERRLGKPVNEAAIAASQARFRAVVLTSATTIAGLLPMLLEQSLQAQILKGLVISICFGLMASTLLVLFVIPALYAILGDFHLIEKLDSPHDKI